MTYNFKYKSNFFWRTIKAIGHNYDQATDQMVVYLPDGGLKTIPKWHLCSLKLGIDWVVKTKKDMEQQSGSSVNIQPR